MTELKRTDDLLTAVDALTRPVRERHTQPVYETVLQDGRPTVGEDGEPVRELKTQRTVTVENPPLLVQLEQAISSTIGAGAGRSMLSASTLNVLDSGALHTFMQISSTIRDWCRMVGVERKPHPVDGLRAWYVACMGVNDRDDTFHIDQLKSWAGQIRAKLNPPRVMELTGVCPECGSGSWADEHGSGYPNPIRLTYHARDDILASATAACQACGFEWRGSTALRALRWNMDHFVETVEQETV